MVKILTVSSVYPLEYLKQYSFYFKGRHFETRNLQDINTTSCREKKPINKKIHLP